MDTILLFCKECRCLLCKHDTCPNCSSSVTERSQYFLGSFSEEDANGMLERYGYIEPPPPPSRQ